MDKNNDIKVNKISKWKEAPDSIKDLYSTINAIFIGLSLIIDPKKADDKNYALNKLLARVLDDYNELEASHQKDTGMISKYEEENRNLKSELDIKTDECDDLISRVFKQDEEYTKLEEEKIDLEKELEDLRETCELLKKVNLKQCNEVDDLEAELKQVIDLAKSYGLMIHDDRKDSIPDNVASIGMCGHYYVFGNDLKNENDCLRNRITQYEEANRRLRDQRKRLKNAHIKLDVYNDHLRQECDRHIDLLDKLRWALEDKGIRVEWSEAALKWNLYDKTNNTCESCKQHYKEELRIREKEIDDKNKLIEELTHENRMLRFKNYMNKRYGIMGHVSSLKDKIQTLEKENKELKDTLAKDREFGNYVGNRVADSIREGCDKGVYKLPPLTRIDIHVEETNSIPIDIPFGRYAIPRIAVIFNNTQTEMERDTAQHECEELEKKFKELVKENEDLRTTFALCERDANMARELCHTIAFNAERAKNKTPWFNE